MSTTLKYFKTKKGSRAIYLKDFHKQAEMLGTYETYKKKLLKSFERNKDFAEIEEGIVIPEVTARKMVDEDIEWNKSAVNWNSTFLEQINCKLTKRNVTENLKMFQKRVDFLQKL